MRQRKPRLKNFASKLADSAQKGKNLRVFAFDETRFGLKSWHRRRWCPFGFRPPWVVQDKYQWFWLYTAVEPATGDFFSLYLPGLDGVCLQVFLEHLKAAHPDYALLLVMDRASSHRSTRVTQPHTQPLLLPPYSLQLNTAERCFQGLRRALANRLFETLETLQGALTYALRPFWHDKPRLAQLTGHPWWLEALHKL